MDLADGTDSGPNQVFAQETPEGVVNDPEAAGFVEELAVAEE